MARLAVLLVMGMVSLSLFGALEARAAGPVDVYEFPDADTEARHLAQRPGLQAAVGGSPVGVVPLPRLPERVVIS